MKPWSTIWLIWSLNLAGLMVFFLVVESLALARKGIGDTLSEQMWKLRDAGSFKFWIILDIITITAVTLAWTLFHFKFQSGRTQ